MLPSGWKETVLHKVSQRVAVGLATSVTEAYSDHGIPIIRNQNIKRGYFDDSNMLYLNEDFSAKHLNKRVRSGDVITVHTGSNVGLTCVVPEKYDLAQTFTTLIVTPKPKELNPNFLCYVLNSDKGEYQALRLVVGGGKGNLNTSDFKRYPLLLPPLPEQIKIAEILSTWDNAINTVQKLLTNSKEQKKALMQQLLTGKKRFAGFEEEWDFLKASEIFKPVSKRNNGEADLLAVTQDQGILPRHLLDRRVVMPEGNTEGYKLVEKGNFVISLRSFQGGIEYSNYRGLVSPAYTILDAHCQIVNEFYRHYFKSYNFIGHLAVAVVGIRDGKQISYSDFSFIKLPNPLLEEQQKIAAVLTTADQEIDNLRAQLSRLEKEKKALMQQLLTGKRRVKVEEAA